MPAAGAAAHSPHRGWYTTSSQASREARAASCSGHRTSCNTSCQVSRGPVRGHWYTTYGFISLDINVVLLYIVKLHLVSVHYLPLLLLAPAPDSGHPGPEVDISISVDISVDIRVYVRVSVDVGVGVRCQAGVVQRLGAGHLQPEVVRHEVEQTGQQLHGGPYTHTGNTGDQTKGWAILGTCCSFPMEPRTLSVCKLWENGQTSQ